MGDCCFQARSALERLRNLCVACLVLDSLFMLIYGLTALSSTRNSQKTECYGAHGYIWHNVITFTFSVSALAAAGGAWVHATLVCSSSNTAQQLLNVSRFAHTLVCWTFVAAILEAVAYRQEPMECADGYYTSSDDSKDDSGGLGAQAGAGQDDSSMIWQVAYTLLWLAWVTGAVAAAVFARRLAPLLPELAAAASATAAHSMSNQGAMPQTVGMPVQNFPGGMIMVGSPGNMPYGGSPGACGPQGTIAGAPCSPAEGAPGAPAGAPPLWQGGVAYGGIVAQGMPVAGSMPDPEKAGGGKVA